MGTSVPSTIYNMSGFNLIRTKINRCGCCTKLSGFAYNFYPADPGSSPKHTINAFIKFVLCRKDDNKPKEAGMGPFKKI